MSGVNWGGALGPSPLTALRGQSDDDPLVGAIRGLLPERSAEDRALGIVRINVGAGDTAETLRVPVAFHGRNQEWQRRFQATFREVLTEVAGDDTGAVMARLLTGETERQLDLLAAYQPVMLSREWLAEHATEEQILDAFLQVTAAAFPTPVALARVLLANRQVAQWVRLQLIQTLYAASTSSSQLNTGGAREPSATS